MNVFKDISLNILEIDRILDPVLNFDIVKRNVLIGDRTSYIYYIDGFLKDTVMQDITRFLMLIEPNRIKNVYTAKDFTKNLLPYIEITSETEFNKASQMLLSGCVLLFIDKIPECIIIDVRTYPQRQIEEPELDKVLRGSKDGFIETPIYNTALIRRRIRNTNFVTEFLTIGEVTNNDIILCYMSDKVNKEDLNLLKDKLNSLKTKHLTFGSQSLIEALYGKKWFNPFPKVKFTERPDVAVSNILEGKIIVIVDNTPAVIILPTYFWDFFQEAEDYYFSPPTANYFRITRLVITIFTLFLTPLWLLALQNINILPQWLSTLISIKENNSIPIVIQLIFLEFVIEILKVASINTPSMISSTISLIGAIVLRRYSYYNKINST